MADETEGAAKGANNFLTRKVGPLPLGVWLVAGIGIYLYYRKKQTAASAAGGTVTPSGTVGTSGRIGSSDQSGGGGSDGNTGTSGSTVSGQYATNDAWARAAINYLVGIGVDPTVANASITQFLGSQALTPEEQADVNLAIQTLGAPPSAPQPGSAPPPVQTPPGGVVYANNPPTGLTVTGTTARTVSLTWNKATNAQNYTVTWFTQGQTRNMTVAGTDTTAVVSGLQSSSTYNITVQATPARPGDPAAAVTASTTPDAPTPTPAPSPAPAPTPVPVGATGGGGGPVPSPPPGMRWQDPQVATLERGRTLRQLSAGLHNNLNTLVQLNPNEGGPDHPAATTHLIRTSNGRWVPA